MLRARWLGRTQFADAHALQRALFERATDPYLLLLEHPHVFTLGLRGTLDHVLADPTTSARPWSAPTGAATSPTTGRASSSATRS